VSAFLQLIQQSLQIHYEGITVVKNKFVIALSTAVLFGPLAWAQSDAVDYGGISSEPSGTALTGKAIWFDLVTEDVDEAIEFYRAVFGWSFDELQDDVYALATNQGQPVAAIAAFEDGDQNRGEAVWLVSISVEDLQLAAETAVREGGEVLEGPETLPGRGRYVLIRDPQGALVMLLNADDGDPADIDTQTNSWLWTELWTSDREAATSFYKSLVGSGSATLSDTGGKPIDVLAHGGQARVTILETPLPDVDPNWLPYLLVDDVNAAEKIKAAGGKLLVAPQRDSRNFDIAIFADPTGGVIAIQEQEQDQ
jgi:hypothetical protein